MAFLEVENIRLRDFGCADSMTFFNALDIDAEFLKSDVDLWKYMPSYTSALEVVKNLNVVNDLAERTISTVTFARKHPRSSTEEGLLGVLRSIKVQTVEKVNS